MLQRNTTDRVLRHRSEGPLSSSSLYRCLLSYSVGEGGGTTVAIVILDSGIDESSKDTAKGVARFRNQLSHRDGHPRFYHRPECKFSFVLSLLSPFFIFTFFFSLCCVSPLRRPSTGGFLSFLLLRPCSSYLSSLSTYGFLHLSDY